MIYIALKLNKVTQKRLTTNMYTKELESTKKLRKLIYMIKNSLKNICIKILKHTKILKCAYKKVKSRIQSTFKIVCFYILQEGKKHHMKNQILHRQIISLQIYFLKMLKIRNDVGNFIIWRNVIS